MEKEAAGISSMRTFLHPYLPASPARAFYSSVSAVLKIIITANCNSISSRLVDQQRLRKKENYNNKYNIL